MTLRAIVTCLLYEPNLFLVQHHAQLSFCLILCHPLAVFLKIQQALQSEQLWVDYFCLHKLNDYISQLENGHWKQSDGPEGDQMKTATESPDSEDYSHIEFIFIEMFTASATNLLTLLGSTEITKHYSMYSMNYELVKIMKWSALLGKCITELSRVKREMKCEKENPSF